MKNIRKKKVLEFIGVFTIILCIFLVIYFIFLYDKSSIIQASTTHPNTTNSQKTAQVTITNPTVSQKTAQTTISNTTISQTKPQTTMYNPTSTQRTITNPTTTQLTVKSPITFNAGQTGSWSVPDGVKEATFTVVGGNGANTIAGSSSGGKGALITTTLSVYPGQIYNVYVGNNGISNKVNSSNDELVLGGKSTVPNGFGNGGNGLNNFASGGSLSALYLNTMPFIVAGGGGGSGYGGNNGLDSTVVSTSGVIDINSNGANGGLLNADSSSLASAGCGGGGLVGGNAGTSLDYFGGNAGTSLVPTTSYTLGLSTGSPSITISW